MTLDTSRASVSCGNESSAPAPDASAAEHGSVSGQLSPSSEQPLSLSDSIFLLAKAIDDQNVLLGQIVAQNADILAAIATDEEDDDKPRFDLAGNPL